MQDENHGSKKVGPEIGFLEKDYRCKESDRWRI